MSTEKRSGNYSSISTYLADSLLIHKAKKLGPVLLFLNRKTEAGSIYCRVCKQTSFVLSRVANCPQCQSFDVIFISLNLKTVSQDLKKLMPDAKFEIIEDNHNKPIPQSEITIATSEVFYLPIVSQFSQIAVISADTSLNLGDFRSQEATFQLLWGLASLPLKKVGILPQIIIQTHNPQLPLIKHALSHNYPAFYQEEISERKSLQYPPFAKFIKLTIKHKTDQKAEELAFDLYNKLADLNIKTVEISDPVRSLSKLPRRNIWNIILKAKKRSDFDQVLAKIPPRQLAGWTINVEPKDLL